MGKLDGKVAVITGGHSGIGLASAKRFVEEGAYVFIVGRRQDTLEKAKFEIGKNVTAIQGDVSNLADLDRVYKTIKAEKGSLDVVVANAGIIERVLLQEATEAHFDRTFDINVKGAYFTVQKSLPLLNKGASIVLVGSVAHLLGVPQHSTYSASKAALRSLSKTFAAELKDRQIRVNTLSPGAVDTPIFDGQAPTKNEVEELKKLYAQWTPIGRIGTPEEIASAVLFLASSESSFSTGIDLVASGGQGQL